jgi:hypothetical protein
MGIARALRDRRGVIAERLLQQHEPWLPCGSAHLRQPRADPLERRLASESYRPGQAVDIIGHHRKRWVIRCGHRCWQGILAVAGVSADRQGRRQQRAASEQQRT